MRACTIVEGRLALADRPVPAPGPGEVVVRVQGAGLNRADLLQRAGGYPAPAGVPADVPGLEFAGVVDAVGADVADLDIGARVFGITGGGAHAEYLAVPAVQCAHVPDGADLVTMGGVPEAFVTAHDAMTRCAALRANEWVVIHAVGSGVGTSALQLAKAMDTRVVGTARHADKLERCRALGLDVGIEPAHTDDGRLDIDALAWSIVEATNGGADVTLDLVGGDYLTADIGAAATLGRIVCIGTVAGGRATVPVVAILAKRLTIVGTVLRARSVTEKAAAMDAFARDVVPLLADGRVAPIVDNIFPLEQANDAYELLASNTTFGKVILDCR